MSKSQQDQVEAAAGHVGARTRDIMLLDFLREYDADCPVCGYNVRAITRPICPECGQELTLAVGAARLRLRWLFAAVAPGFFSGIAAFFMLVVIIIAFILNDPAPWHLIATDLFGWCSGLLAIIIIRWRIRFIAQPLKRQRLWVLAIWLLHLAAFIALFL